MITVNCPCGSKFFYKSDRRETRFKCSTCNRWYIRYYDGKEERYVLDGE